MAETKWTPEQLAAITTSGCNLLVAAAAGAGKTAVLVERIIRKITDFENPIDIDSMLVVTFTNAAATEMRQRIGEAISKALDANPDSTQLQKQLALVHKASITTIHSFCLEVIRNNFHVIDIDPNFKIADATESVLMKMEALEEVFEERYEDEKMTEQFAALVECYGGNRDDTLLQEMVFDLHSFVQSTPWPKKWLYDKAMDFDIPQGSDFSETQWAKILMQNLEIELKGMADILQEGLQICNSAEGLSPYASNFIDDLSGINSLIQKCGGTWDNLCNGFASFAFGKLSRCGKEVDKDRQEIVKDMRDEVKGRIKKLKDDIFCYDSLEIREDLQRLYPLLQCLGTLVLEFDQRYRDKKKERALLDFNDLEHFSLDILTETDENGNIIPSDVALDFQKKFEEVMIDEYQDSNMVQEFLLSTISRRDMESPNVFMVGDVKQSIYRFRQAKPELFMQKYNTYTDDESKSRRILLYKNFRSRSEVITAVNFIFRQIMSENIGELDYNQKEALNLGASYEDLEEEGNLAGGAVELHLIDKSGEAEEDIGQSEDGEIEGQQVEESAMSETPQNEMLRFMTQEPADNILCEARVVAKRIQELIAQDEQGKGFRVLDRSSGEYRPLQYKDIVILMRATRSWADVFVEEFAVQGIPAYADTGAGYFQTIEVQTVMSLLQIIDNPMQDIPLLAVLRSPIVMFTPEELIDIRLIDREGPFYQAMVKAAESEDSAIGARCHSFLDKLAKWRDKAMHMSTDELIWYLCSDTGYYSFVAAMPSGQQRQANLRILFERARQYENTSFKGLFNFIHFINKLKASGGDMGSAKILGENENVVRIMSIHKSKGLEFPVVFVCGCGKNFNLQDMNRAILLHQDLGFGPDFVDHKRRISYPTIPKQALRSKIRFENLSEEMRILYVAFTRAKEKLIITGTVSDIEKVASRWGRVNKLKGEKLPEYTMLKARNYLDWIGPSLIRHTDGKTLRIAAGIDDGGNEYLKDGSNWKVCIWNKNEIKATQKQIEKEEKEFLNKLHDQEISEEFSPYRDEIIRRLEWQYRYSHAAKLPVKMTVTELKRRHNEEIADLYSSPYYIPPLIEKPAFMEETKGLSAAEKGTALHFVMQHLDLPKISEAAQMLYESHVTEHKSVNIPVLDSEISRQINDMVEHELLTEVQAKAVDVYKINRFFNSALGKRFLQADHIYREVPFNIEIQCTEIYTDLCDGNYDDEMILLQGVIDCYFEEQGDIILIDYKTDYVPKGNSNIIKEKYKVQIENYARVLKEITGKDVKGKYIYLFYNAEVLMY